MLRTFQQSWCCYILFGFSIIIFVYYYFVESFDFWKNRGVPHKKPKIFFGNFAPLLLFRKSLPDGINEMYQGFDEERYFGAYRVKTPLLILRDPELIKNVCVKDFACFANRGIPVNPQDPLSAHLFNLEGEKWKNLRSKLTSAFSSGKIKRMFYLLTECCEEFQKVIDASVRMDRVVETRELATKFIIDVIGSCVFGIQINALTNDQSEFHRAAKELSRPSYKASLWRMLRTAMPRLYRLLGVQVIDPTVTRFFQNVVSKMIKDREQQETRRHDFLDLLIELKNNGRLDTNDVETAKDIELDENTIAAQAFVFFVAGFETSSNTIAFCLHELALNMHHQVKTRKDIHDGLKRQNGNLSYEAINEMKYLDMVVSETLRKYPPAALVSRKCEYPYRIPDTEVELPAGMRVIVPIYGLHHDPKHYPEPEMFQPERFKDDNKYSRHPYTYLPFGGGPRNCIGQRFALLQVKMGIISFLKSHKIEICKKSSVPIRFSRRSLVTSSEDGFWLKFTPMEET